MERSYHWFKKGPDSLDGAGPSYVFSGPGGQSPFSKGLGVAKRGGAFTEGGFTGPSHEAHLLREAFFGKCHRFLRWRNSAVPPG